MIDLRHLSYFRVVADLGSLVAAAEALHLTQPTLSRQIAQLERAVGHQLLVRTSRGTSLTPAGVGLRTQADAILLQVDRVDEVVRAHADGDRVVQVGIPAGLPHRWFSRFRNELAAREPSLRLAIVEATSERQQAMLHAGLLDIGLVHAEPTTGRTATVLAQPFGCVVLDDALLIGRTTAHLRDLADLVVMSHAATQTPAEEARLRSAATADGVTIDWQFREFAEHGELVAEDAGADVVLLAEESASRHFPGRRWIPFARDEAYSTVVTWAHWVDPDLASAVALVEAMRVASNTFSR